MSRWLAAVFAASVLVVVAWPNATQAAPDGGARDAGPPVPACVSVHSYARYGAVGYDHIVSISNGCSKLVDCVVRTDVSADPILASIPPRQSTDLVTWRGSPAYTFKADVKCAEK